MSAVLKPRALARGVGSFPIELKVKRLKSMSLKTCGATKRNMLEKRINSCQEGIVKEKICKKAKKRKVKGKIVLVEDLKLKKRGLKLIPISSRVVMSEEIHELISTDEKEAKPGEEVNNIAVIGFVEFDTGGVIAVGDKFVIKGKEIGLIAGFDETHAPNHLNIVLKASKKVSGFDLGIELGGGCRR